MDIFVGNLEFFYGKENIKMFYCPDCRGLVELKEVNQMVMGKDDLSIFVEEQYFKCPKCRKEFDLDTLEE